MFHNVAQLPRQIRQTPISLSIIGQLVQLHKSKSTQPRSQGDCYTVVVLKENGQSASPFFRPFSVRIPSSLIQPMEYSARRFPPLPLSSETEWVFLARKVSYLPKLKTILQNNSILQHTPLSSCFKLCGMGKTAAYFIMNANSLDDKCSGAPPNI